jgi:2-phosphoglycerate kinase
MMESLNKSLYPYGGLPRQLLATGLDYLQVSNVLERIGENKTLDLPNFALRRLSIWSSFLQLMKSDQAVPLVILVGGGSGTGKSTLAAEIAYLMGIRNTIGTDMLREVLRLKYSIESEPELYENTYNCWKPLSSSYEPEYLKQGYYRQSQLIFTAVEAIIDRVLSDGESVVLEGIHLLPSLLSSDLLVRPNVISVVLQLRDAELHQARLYDRGRSTHVMKPGSRYIPVFEKIRLVHNLFVQDAQSKSVPVIEQSSPDTSLQCALDIIYDALEEVLEDTSFT